jgi:hypothetical protein
LDQHPIAVRQHVRHSPPTAIFDVVVDRMVVSAGALKRQAERICHRAARQDEALAELEVVKLLLLESLCCSESNNPLMVI